MAPEDDHTKPATENVDRQPSSASSVRKPKPPKTPKSPTRAARRKATNSFQPASDGLLLRRIAYGNDGQAIPGIHRRFADSAKKRLQLRGTLRSLFTYILIWL
jgi:hypothetical protein